MYKTFVSNDINIKETFIPRSTSQNNEFNIFKKKSVERLNLIESNAFNTDFLDNALKTLNSKQESTPFWKLRKVTSESEYFKRTVSTDMAEGTTHVMSSDSSNRKLYSSNL